MAQVHMVPTGGLRHGRIVGRGLRLISKRQRFTSTGTIWSGATMAPPLGFGFVRDESVGARTARAAAAPALAFLAVTLIGLARVNDRSYWYDEAVTASI